MSFAVFVVLLSFQHIFVSEGAQLCAIHVFPLFLSDPKGREIGDFLSISMISQDFLLILLFSLISSPFP